MFVSRKLSFLPIIAILVLVGLFAFYSPVHAEDTVPPVSDTPAETQSEAPASDSPVEQAPPVESEPAEVTASAEPQPDAPAVESPVEPPVVENAPVEAPADAPVEVFETPAAEIPAENLEPAVVSGLEQPTPSTGLATDVQIALGEQTDLVAVNPEGEEVPLATTESEEILATGDPYFTVGSTLYQFFKTGSGLCGVSTTCWESDTPIQAALDYMAANSLTPTDRKLYVEADTYNETVVINGSLNGVNGLIGLVGMGTTPEAVTINGSLTIQNFLTGFSVNNIFVFNNTCSNCAAIVAEDNHGLLKLTDVKATATGTNSRGIEIHHSGSVELNRVNATGSTSHGLYIENSTTGALIIKNSSISGNATGLYIDTNGPATLTGVSANDNYDDYGASIHSYGLTINQSIFSNNGGNGLEVIAHDSGGNLTIQNSQFNNNGNNGILAQQKGNISITNIRATSNQADGVNLDTCFWDGIDGHTCANPFAGNVSVLKSAIIGNGISIDGSGLYVLAKGTITVTDVDSSLNGNSIDIPAIEGYGALLYNNRAAVAAPVNVTNSTFNKNNQTGLIVLSRGIITVKDINASNNENEGATLDNRNAGVVAGINVLTSPDVVDNFNYNQDNGLKVYSNGAVVLNAVNADGNVGGGGILVDNSGGIGAVTIDGVRGTSISNNGGDGIWVVSKGFITLKNMDVNWNLGSGALLDNQAGTTGVSILVTLPGWYNGFQNNTEDGLRIVTNGAVIVQKSKANNNEHNGAYIINSTGLGNVTITDSSFNINGQTAPTSGFDYGLFVQTRGIVALTNINANGNGFNAVLPGDDVYSGGAWLDNSTSPTAKTITITKGYFVDNFGIGFNALASGAVTYKTGTISNNESSGVSIDNSTSIGNQNVTVDSVNFWGSGKGAWGLKILSKGNILINASEINNFDGDGTVLNNTFGTGNPTVVITGARTLYRNFGYNGETGLSIDTNGAVTLSQISVSENGANGARIVTSGPTAMVSITNAEFLVNGKDSGAIDKYGLYVISKGNILLDNVQITDNGDYGAKLDNSAGAGTVTIKSASGREIRNNSAYGLWVTSKGNIILTNISVKLNDGYGAWLDNTFGTIGTVTINNTLYTGWQGNGSFGLQINAMGAVSINLVDAYLNNGTNAIIDNTGAISPAIPAVTITNSWFDESQNGNGLDVDSKGNIILTNVVVNGNVLGHGAFLNNGGAGGKGSVTISGTSADDRRSFNANDEYGLQVISNGTVTIKFVDASDNGSYGAKINNSGAATPLPVTITSGNFDGNATVTAGFGLQVYSKGAITGTDVKALNNGDSGTLSDGMELDNCREVGGFCTGTGAVKLTNAGGHGNSGDGMNVESYGLITLVDVGAGWNGLNGATFHNNNTIHPLLVDIKSIAGISLSVPAGYSSANGVFANNGGYGLEITSNGAITVSYATVSNNGTTGNAAYIDNSTAATPLAVTITKSKFNDNNSAIRGILVVSNGAITFSNNEVGRNNGASSDDRGAAELDNHLSTSVAAPIVTVANGNFHDNANGDGLLVITRGNVLLTNVLASSNAFDGIAVNATYGNGTVTLNGTQNTFHANGDNGVEILAKGNVSVTNITAEYNSGDGLAIDNCGFDGSVCAGTGTGTITVSNANLNRNSYNGIWASSNGLINLTNVTGMGNGTGGVSGTKTFDGAHLTANAKNITITNSSFSGNGGTGIWSDTGAANTLNLVGTSYFGNNRKGGAYPNLHYTGLVTIS
jgi:hypothetical protein